VRANWGGFDHIQGVFDAWQRLAPATDRRLSSVLSNGRGGTELSAILQSGPPEEATELLAPVLSAGRPDVSAESGSWVDIFLGLQPPPDSPVEQAKNWKFNSQFISTPFPAEAIDLVAEYSAAAPSAASDYFCSSLGGAVTEPPPGGSAFVHRDALFYAEPGAGWNGDELTPKALAWVAEFSEALQPYVSGAYVNVPNAEAADWEVAYWGEHYPRLREIKSKYDPDNVFRYEQSIAPA
jgi:FAD/FMN-containing dehydrogenase